MYLRAFQRRDRLAWAMVPCRLYEQVHHSFVVTEQERGLKGPRQPTKIVIRPRQAHLVVKLYDEDRLHESRMQRYRGLVDVDELGYSRMKLILYKKIWIFGVRSSDSGTLTTRITQVFAEKVHSLRCLTLRS
jgi:hypothetical protein